MATKVVSWVLESSPAQLINRLVLIVLADHANADGTGAWPSTETIAREARCSVRSVQYALNALADAGAITQSGWSGPGTRIWTVLMSDAAAGAIFAPRPIGSDADLAPHLAPTDAIHGADPAPEPSVNRPRTNSTPQPPQAGERPIAPQGDRKRDHRRYLAELEAWAPHPTQQDRDAAGAWDGFADLVRPHIREDIWRFYLSPLHPHRMDGDTLVLAGPAQAIAWVEQRYGRMIAHAVNREVDFVPCAQVEAGAA